MDVNCKLSILSIFEWFEHQFLSWMSSIHVCIDGVYMCLYMCGLSWFIPIYIYIQHTVHKFIVCLWSTWLSLNVFKCHETVVTEKKQLNRSMDDALGVDAKHWHATHGMCVPWEIQWQQPPLLLTTCKKTDVVQFRCGSLYVSARSKTTTCLGTVNHNYWQLMSLKLAALGKKQWV